MLSLPTPLTQIRQRLFAAGHPAARRLVRQGRRGLRLRTRVRWLRTKLTPLPGAELARRTWRELGDDHSIDLAASIAYYSILSLFPLAIGLVTLFSMVLEADVVEAEVHRFFQTYLPGSHGILQANVESVSNIRGVLGIVSIVGLLWSASLLFGAITRAVNRAWDIEQDRPFYIDKPRQILMALCVAPFFLLSLVLTSGLQFIAGEEIPVLGRLAFLEHNGINASAFLFHFCNIHVHIQVHSDDPDPLAVHLAGCFACRAAVRGGQEHFHLLSRPLRRLRTDLRNPGLGNYPSGLDLCVGIHCGHRS